MTCAAIESVLEKRKAVFMTVDQEHEIIGSLKLTAMEMSLLAWHRIRLVVDETMHNKIRGILPGEVGYEDAPYEVSLLNSSGDILPGSGYGATK
jgi:hypothetical protein